MFYMALIGILFFLILILLAVRFGITKQRLEAERESQSVIHTSGIYSIVRKSPREDIEQFKPSEQEITQYLSTQTVDIHGNTLTDDVRQALIALWKQNLESALQEIEEGDKQGLEFYYYDLTEDDEVCDEFLDNGHFVTRQDIFHHPELIPPFHIGCRCTLKCHHGSDKLRDTTEFGMRPFLEKDVLPPLPDWKRILKI